MTVEEEYYNVYLPQKWKQDDIVRNIRSKITSEEYEFIGKLYMCKAIGEIKAEIEQLRNFRAEDYDLEQYCDYFDARIIFRDDALQIIDKYR